MSIMPLRSLVIACSLVGFAVTVGWAAVPATDDFKPAIELPKDPKTVVLSYDPGAGGFIRQSPPPYLKIQADGQVVVASLHNKTTKEAQLSPRQLDDLLKFVVKDQDFFNLSEPKMLEEIRLTAGNGPFIAVGGAGTTVIGVQLNSKKHEAHFRAASAYVRQYPSCKTLTQFVAVEKRLQDLALSIEKAK